MPQFLGTILFIIAFAFIGISQALFTVDETEQAIVLQFGQPIGEGDDLFKQAGLHYKIPFVQQVRYFDGRILSVDPRPERVNISSFEQTSDTTPDAKETSEGAEGGEEEVASIIAETSGEPILVDTFARYRIVDPLSFLKTMQTVNNANARIEGIVKNVTRNILGKTTLREILSEQRTEIMSQIKERVNMAMKQGNFGVEIVDIRIVRADLTEKLRTSTVNRMITELRERATETRAKGRELALEIRSKAEKEKSVLLAEANRDSQVIRGQGDKEAIRIFADAFNVDPDFYSFIRSMEAYSKTFEGQGGTQLILSPDSDFLKFFRDRAAR